MIPRFQTTYGRGELLRLLMPANLTPRDFETDLAKLFQLRGAVSFAYGREAQRAFFVANDLADVEVIIPAYTCSVVAHAVALSGNTPVFADVEIDSFNSSPQQIADRITPKTRAVIATHTFGYPQDMVGIREVVRAAETRYGHKIWIVSDCAHAFHARFNDEPVAHQADVTIVGLNISKTINSIFGGALLSNNEETLERVANLRGLSRKENHLREAKHRLYGLASYVALDTPFFALTYQLMSRTSMLRGLTDSYHLDDRVAFPPDAGDRMTKIGSTVGCTQIKRYEQKIDWRSRVAQRYLSELQVPMGSKMPPHVEGATYSHFVIQVPNRENAVRWWAKRGVQIGTLIQYSLPKLTPYMTSPHQCPNALRLSETTINIPIAVKQRHVDRIIRLSHSWTSN